MNEKLMIIAHIREQYGEMTIRMMELSGETVVLKPVGWDEKRWADSVAQHIAYDGLSVIVEY